MLALQKVIDGVPFHQRVVWPSVSMLALETELDAKIVEAELACLVDANIVIFDRVDKTYGLKDWHPVGDVRSEDLPN